MDLLTTTVEADIHPIPTSSVVDTIANPSVSVVSTVNTVAATSGTSTTGAEQASTSAASAAGQLIPLSATQIAQLITPGSGCAVGCPQQIINVGGTECPNLGKWSWNHWIIQCTIWEDIEGHLQVLLSHVQETLHSKRKLNKAHG